MLSCCLTNVPLGYNTGLNRTLCKILVTMSYSNIVEKQSWEEACQPPTGHLAKYQLTMATADPREGKWTMNKNETNSISHLFSKGDAYHLVLIKIQRGPWLVTAVEAFIYDFFMLFFSQQSQWMLFMDVHSRLSTWHAPNERQEQKPTVFAFFFFFLADCQNQGMLRGNII